MAANRKKTKIIRARKAKPSKRNLKANRLRVQLNAEILRDLASGEEK